MKESGCVANKLSKDNQPAKIGETYWVQCKNYRTLAVMGTNGTWRAICDGRELFDVLGFYLDP
jgi:hypothetical protein